MNDLARFWARASELPREHGLLEIMLCFIAASVPCLVVSPSPARSMIDRRTALQQGAGGLFAATVLAAPTPAFASAAGGRQAFDDVKEAASGSLASTSKLIEKVDTLTFAPNKETFLFSASNVCKSPGDYVSIRLWRPTGGETASEIVKSFEARFEANKAKPEGFKNYWGAVVRANEGEEFAMFANVVQTAEQAEKINTAELGISKKKVLRANLQIILPVFSSETLSIALGGC